MSFPSKVDKVLPVIAIAILGVLGGALAYTLLDEGQGLPTNDAGAPALPDPGAKMALFSSERVAFLPVELDTAAISEGRAALKGVGDPAPDGTDAVMKSFRALNLLEVSGDKDAQQKEATEFNLRLTEFYGVRHNAGVQALMSSTFSDFSAGLDKLTAEAQSKNVDIETLLTSPTDATREAVGWAGGFVKLARRLGLMDKTGKVPARLEPMVELLYRYRIAQGMRTTINPRELMAKAEMHALLTWRLQEAKGIPRAKRMRYIAELAFTRPNFPTAIAKAVVYHEDGRTEDALKNLGRAGTLHPKYKDTAERYTAILTSKK